MSSGWMHPADFWRARQEQPRPVESVRYAPGLPLPSSPCGACAGSGYSVNWDGSDNGACLACGGHGAGPAGEDFVESLVRQLVEVTVRQEEERLALELEAGLDRLQREEPGVYAEVLKRYKLLRAYVEANRDALAADDAAGEL